ncbi:hypothetical protein SAMN05660473_04157 [Arthrobacter sp. 49Tsu3.1M3]|uniref:hypothetical protein n=1 Tax=Arthrobacter sp. 49Tsu3.1M3 TaxID=1279029 RepID=UPI0009C9C698|nr:hypothetical protein [Arthrobacter sp. 49Tsu3.1M3]SKC10007.1 hypothetical protein SAMN05660473_04157 [Arthrobacter sp. 49Tsu3.1M3]
MTKTSTPTVMSMVASTGRYREWRVVLAPNQQVADLHTGSPFTPGLAVIRISAAAEDEPFTALRVDLIGNGKKNRLFRQYRNDIPNPDFSILTAPAWVRDLFVDVTGAPELINTYAGPGLGAAAYVKHTTPDVRFPAPDAQGPRQDRQEP